MNNNIIGIYIEIVSYCNQRCAYCYNSDMLDKHYELDIKVLCKLIDNLKERGINSITISGGEPFLYNNICELIKYTHKKGMKITIITNFTIYNEKLYTFLTYLNVDLQVTLDGHNSFIHDKTRGKNTFDKIVNNIMILKNKYNYTGKIHIRMNLHNKNITCIENTYELVKKLGCNSLGLSLIYNTGNAKDFAEILSLNNENVSEDIANIIDKIAICKDIPINYDKIKPSIGCPYYGNDNIDCGLRIASDGFVYPCQMFNNKIFNIGNIYADSLEEIINGKKMNNFINLLKLKKTYTEKCYNCAYQGFCNTGCPAEAFNNNGNIFSTTGKCYLNKRVFKEVIKLDMKYEELNN